MKYDSGKLGVVFAQEQFHVQENQEYGLFFSFQSISTSDELPSKSTA